MPKGSNHKHKSCLTVTAPSYGQWCRSKQSCSAVLRNKREHEMSWTNKMLYKYETEVGLIVGILWGEWLLCVKITIFDALHCIKFWKYDDEPKDRVTYPFISGRHSHIRVDKRVREHTTNFEHLPGYFIQGISIWWWHHKACPREGFDHPIEGLKLPVLKINIGLQHQCLATSQHFLRQKKRQWSSGNERTAWI